VFKNANILRRSGNVYFNLRDMMEQLNMAFFTGTIVNNWLCFRRSCMTSAYWQGLSAMDAASIVARTSKTKAFERESVWKERGRYDL